MPATDLSSEIQFRNALWSRYRVEILLITAALCLQSGLIAWLIIEHRRRQRAELQSRNAMAELTRLDRRAGAGALSASIAHEVSQPLAAISARTGAALRWLRAEKPDVERASAALEHVVAATRRASDVVDGVCAMFKKDATVRLSIDVNELVLTILSIVRVELRRSGVEVQTCLSERLPTVLGARAQLQQVVLNLMINAIEAMQPARVRVLKVSTAESKPGIVRVSIQDSGTGVPAEHRARIFDALFTTKSSGMGVGLSICKSIIETHDGRIWSEPGHGGGSVFWFELPVATTLDAPALAEAHEITRLSRARYFVSGAATRHPESP